MAEDSFQGRNFVFLLLSVVIENIGLLLGSNEWKFPRRRLLETAWRSWESGVPWLYKVRDKDGRDRIYQLLQFQMLMLPRVEALHGMNSKPSKIGPGLQAKVQTTCQPSESTEDLVAMA